MHLIRASGRLACVLSALISCGCALRDVHSFAERGFDPARYHTYRWAPADDRATGDPRLDDNPFFQRSVQTAVESELAKRGFEKTTSETADLVIDYYAHVTQRVERAGADLVYRSCTDCPPYVYDAGSLMIDLVEGRTRALLWRGWAEGDISGLIDNQSWLEERIGQAVARILERLPRGV
jgi:Domain of unknown function (DUF4136)